MLVKTQYVGGVTLVAKGHPELQIIGRYIDFNKQCYVVLYNNVVQTRGLDLEQLKQFCDQNF